MHPFFTDSNILIYAYAHGFFSVDYHISKILHNDWLIVEIFLILFLNGLIMAENEAHYILVMIDS